MELELNSLDWNVNELEHELELEDMKPTCIWVQVIPLTIQDQFYTIQNL